MVKKYKVSLFGETYTIISDESEEHIALCVQKVDSLMKSLTESMHIADSKKAAILAALQCASRLLSLEHNYQLKQQEQEKLIDLIDRELSGPAFR